MRGTGTASVDAALLMVLAACIGRSSTRDIDSTPVYMRKAERAIKSQQSFLYLSTCMSGTEFEPVLFHGSCHVSYFLAINRGEGTGFDTSNPILT